MLTSDQKSPKNEKSLSNFVLCNEIRFFILWHEFFFHVTFMSAKFLTCYMYLDVCGRRCHLWTFFFLRDESILIQIIFGFFFSLNTLSRVTIRTFLVKNGLFWTPKLMVFALQWVFSLKKIGSFLSIYEISSNFQKMSEIACKQLKKVIF